ncbi:MAG TPA: T9SS type A sorting domain-containing protein [Bacteroidales bacterium]|nr:T9SS type A sorting domain-containing protein [Bacteroidales bacterium]HPT03408.1 T9SS type A sorting domain-containing protein [Bacteroidales bacterium]
MKKLTLIIALLALATLADAQWQSNAALNTPIGVYSGEQVVTKVATHSSGITYYAWFSLEGGNYNVRLQKTDVYGNIAFGSAGLLVSNHTSDSWITDFDMTVDNDTCAVIAFQDIRTGNNDVFAYRVSPSGEMLWGNDGIRLSTSTDADYTPVVTVTDEGNAVVVWEESSSVEKVRVQKISPSGSKLWGSSGITLQGAGTESYTFPRVFAAPDDQAFVLWFKKDAGLYSPKHLYAQKISPDGSPVWSSDVVIFDGSGVSMIPTIDFVPDGSNGFYVAWYDDRNNDWNYSTYVQHIDGFGQVQMTVNGVEAIVNNSNNHMYPSITLSPDGQDLFVFVSEMDADQEMRGLYGQRISSSGQRLWPNTGKMFIGLSSLDVGMLKAQMADTNIVVIYCKNNSFGGDQVKAMKIDPTGAYLWPSGGHIVVSSSNGSKSDLVAGVYNSGQFIAAWSDQRSDAGDIYGQNITTEGTLGAQQFALVLSPDTVIFDQSCSPFMVGKYFSIKNPMSYPVSIDTLDLDAFLPEGQHWYVDTVLSFPVVIPPADSLRLNVKLDWIIKDDFGGYVTDTMNIFSSVGPYREIIMIDSAYLWSAIDKAEKSNPLTLYPNPATDLVRIRFTGNDPVESVVITDPSGRVVKQAAVPASPAPTVQFSVAGLPSGEYLVRVYTQRGKPETGKLIVRH